MGRIKGSKNKPKTDKGTRPVTGQSIVASINSSLSKFAHLKNQPKIENLDFADPSATVPTETPYPSNWDSLGKVAKLQWLTAEKAKK